MQPRGARRAAAIENVTSRAQTAIGTTGNVRGRHRATRSTTSTTRSTHARKTGCPTCGAGRYGAFASGARSAYSDSSTCGRHVDQRNRKTAAAATGGDRGLPCARGSARTAAAAATYDDDLNLGRADGGGVRA